MGRKNHFGNIFALGGLALLPVAVVGNHHPEAFAGFMMDDWENAVLPIYIMIVSLLVAWSVIRRKPALIWTPAFLFPLQSAVFFGFGSLVEVFGNEATMHFNLTNNLAMTTLEYAASNALSALGIMLIFFGFWLHTSLAVNVWQNLHRQAHFFPSVPMSPSVVVIAFTLGGFCLTYLLVKPAQWGIFNIVVPGALTSITPLVHVGFGLVVYLAARGNRKMSLFLWVFWPLHLALVWLMLEKVEIILAVLLPMIGAFMANRNFLQFSISILALFVMFYVSQPYVTSSRAVIQMEAGNIDEASYVRRAEIAFDYIIGKHRIERDEDDVEFWWRRLNYSAAQSYAIRAFNSGETMNTFDEFWMRFVPRLLWPDKPVQYGLGRTFYERISGQQGSSLGLGIYGDAYWQYGFISVFITMTLIGILFSYLSMLGLAILERREFIYFPLILLALKMAVLGPLGFISEAIISPLPIMFVYYLLIISSIRLTTRRRRQAISIK